MYSPFGFHAYNDAINFGNALLKFISPNDVGITGSHQCGFYLPFSVFRQYTTIVPEKGKNKDQLVTIQWQDGRITNSRITWYGNGTRSEFRLTRFGKDFPFLQADAVGNLLVLIRQDVNNFIAYVLDIDEDIEEIQALLGIELLASWGIFNINETAQIESENECINRKFRNFCNQLESFPSGLQFSDFCWNSLIECKKKFLSQTIDKQLLDCIGAEYELYKMAERKLCAPEIRRLFESIDDFLRTALTISNRRKARAGRSLENHVSVLLQQQKIPYTLRPSEKELGGIDLIIPGKQYYLDSSYPVEKLFAIGIKTTCKDRWRQVLNEARKVSQKHIITLQQGISKNMLNEMYSSKVSLIVPEGYHNFYPKDSFMSIQSLENFVMTIKTVIPECIE